jgi:hypothetical protein
MTRSESSEKDNSIPSHIVVVALVAVGVLWAGCFSGNGSLVGEINVVVARICCAVLIRIYDCRSLYNLEFSETGVGHVVSGLPYST